MLNVFKTIQLYSNNNKWKHIKRNQIFWTIFSKFLFMTDLQTSYMMTLTWHCIDPV